METVVRLRVGDIVQWQGCYGRVTAISKQFPDGSGRRLKNVQVKIDGESMAYGRSHRAEVKRLC